MTEYRQNTVKIEENDRVNERQFDGQTWIILTQQAVVLIQMCLFMYLWSKSKFKTFNTNCILYAVL